MALGFPIRSVASLRSEIANRAASDGSWSSEVRGEGDSAQVRIKHSDADGAILIIPRAIFLEFMNEERQGNRLGNVPLSLRNVERAITSDQANPANLQAALNDAMPGANWGTPGRDGISTRAPLTEAQAKNLAKMLAEFSGIPKDGSGISVVSSGNNYSVRIRDWSLITEGALENLRDMRSQVRARTEVILPPPPRGSNQQQSFNMNDVKPQTGLPDLDDSNPVRNM